MSNDDDDVLDALNALNLLMYPIGDIQTQEESEANKQWTGN